MHVITTDKNKGHEFEREHIGWFAGRGKEEEMMELYYNLKNRKYLKKTKQTTP